MMYET